MFFKKNKKLKLAQELEKMVKEADENISKLEASRNNYLEELKKSSKILEEKLAAKTLSIDNKLKEKYSIKLEEFKEREFIYSRSEVEDSLNFLLNQTNGWNGFVEDERKFHPPKELSSTLSFPKHDNDIKVFETWNSMSDIVGENIVKEEFKLIQIIELSNEKLQLRTYQNKEKYGKIVAILRGANVIFEADIYESGDSEFSTYNIGTVNILTEIEWISSFLEFTIIVRNALHERIIKNRSFDDFLIKKNNL